MEGSEAPRGRGRPRRGRGGRGAGRGSSDSPSANNQQQQQQQQQRSVVVPHRPGGLALALGTGPRSASSPGSGGSGFGSVLTASAPEFIPGQPVAAPAPEPKQPETRRPEARRPAATRPKKKRPERSHAPDRSTQIHEDLQNGIYECSICTEDIRPASPTWSCSICWAVVHLPCVQKWHARNVELNKTSWRCPCCNSEHVGKPANRCWCGKESDPRPIPGLPPKTCGQTCSKSSGSCPHPCPIMCHAGPCPPCLKMGPTLTCFCGKHASTKPCQKLESTKPWSCQEICGDLLACGEHTCPWPCHSGLCGDCEVPIPSICYCGSERAAIPCSQRGDVLASFNHGQLAASQESEDAAPGSGFWFDGSFKCGKLCSRLNDCGNENHTCQQPCHPQDEAPVPCPLSPEAVTHCPCGQTLLKDMPVEPRQSCQDPIPLCGKPCNKILPCRHPCLAECHHGDCPKCTQIVELPCRCGREVIETVCQNEAEPPKCGRTCKARLNCGRHVCKEQCCPGGQKQKAPKRRRNPAPEQFPDDDHICTKVCGRKLKCGKHTCLEACHPGECPGCLEAVFDDVTCPCGKTVFRAPLLCGMPLPECRFNCTKVKQCGHPPIQHPCHPDDTPCTVCPFLVEKSCICGKKKLTNQPCWFDAVRCGLPCGKKLKCGDHSCQKSCHAAGECEDADITEPHCSQPCGKVRDSCQHTCTDPCHAPNACKEERPCQFKTFITCACQTRKQEVRCQATKNKPEPSQGTVLDCDDECLRLQRNRLLADALKIDPETRKDDKIPYSNATLKMFAENATWAQTQEREFRVFAAAADERRLNFKPMESRQRAFIHALAEDFGLDSISQDLEPDRHVMIFKTPRFVSAPSKTLAQCTSIMRTAANLRAAPSSLQSSPPPATDTPFNALVLKDPRFGLTVEELDHAIASDLAAAARAGPPLTFTTTFLPSDEILVKATPIVTAAATLVSSTPLPLAMASALADLKPAIAATVSRLGLANAVVLCHADSSLGITRREAPANVDGWNSIASRGSWQRGKAGSSGRAPGAASSSSAEQRAPRSFFALRKLVEKNKKSTVAATGHEVEEDWLTAAERIMSEEGKKKEEGDRETVKVEAGPSGAELVVVDQEDKGKGKEKTEMEVEMPTSPEENASPSLPEPVFQLKAGFVRVGNQMLG
ncbi:hypothetical protein B0T22DRAFT_87619 [Podospora appendiculata]|uniref:R3H domain-containing protein n=1 Tax=Podospora appendiculata TaxID=314037 RepID=A0AAE0XKQ2_9PEZI|nr:hypothetical protein B0T22DRAFT_87619 [Podospora appendiculata]